MQFENSLTKTLGIEFPMIMAPMFLVSNLPMMVSGIENGIAAAFPSLNYREDGELERILKELNECKSKNEGKGTYGINLIVQRSNPLLDQHLEICRRLQVPFYITSLGSPKKVIEIARTYGAKVFCDVTNLAHAQKCYELGCDGFIAVGQGAGGHAGPNPLMLLVPALRKAYPDKIVIAAGGIATGNAVASVFALGGHGVSVGTRFIASHEASVNDAYKNAVVNSGMDDIVMSSKISGTPCTIVNTPYAQKIGYDQSWFEKLLSRNKTTRKYFKMLVQLKGMKKLEASIKPANYKTLWVVGKSAEMIDEISTVKFIIEKIRNETRAVLSQISKI